MDKWLYLSGTSIIGLLGLVHLVFMMLDEKTPKRLIPNTKELLKKMQKDSLRMTSETTMWRAWVGFNHSHSVGAIFIGLLYGYMVIENYELLQSLVPVYFAAPVVAWVYVWLAKAYWFSRPHRGLLVSAVLLTTSVLIA